MTPTKGPTKKLAPTISPERCCPHEWTEDDGLQLEVDCSSCSGGNSLANPKCLAGVLKALISGGVPDAIVLKSYIQKRYRGELVTSASLVASELASLDRMLVSASIERPSDKRCRTCRASNGELMAFLRKSILEDPASFALDRLGFLKRVSEDVSPLECAKANECVSKVLGLALPKPG